MNAIRDKVIGSWFGMAVGDAMGSAAQGLKPATISQCFREMDGYKDVRPFVGRGIKHFKMPGLYSWQTQMALAVCDTLLKHKNPNLQEIAACFQQLTQGGPENYFGVYRHPSAWFRKTVETLSHQNDLKQADRSSASGTYLATAIPIALYYRGRTSVITERCLDTCVMMSRNPLELVGTALTAFLIDHFLSLEIEPQDEPPAVLENILQTSAEFCRATESSLKNRIGDDMQEKDGQTLSDIFRLLEENWRKLELPEILALVCRNASTHTKQPVAHAAQGYVLTLLPLAVITLMKTGADFAPALTSVLNRGGEANKLGAITGAFAGALYGFSRIPPDWKSGLVNAKEIQGRGEALFAKRSSSKLKDLYEMESGLTLKECESKRKYARRKPKTPARRTPVPVLESDSADLPVSKKDDPAQWRKYQKDKTKNKRDRRKNLGKYLIDDD